MRSFVIVFYPAMMVFMPPCATAFFMNLHRRHCLLVKLLIGEGGAFSQGVLY
jgi:hypothetical protein